MDLGSLLPPGSAAPGESNAMPDPGTLMMKVAGTTHGGAVPMVKGGKIHDFYPNIRAMSHVAWRQVNPRLMESLQKLGEKHQFTVVLQSGYRDHGHNAAINGHPTSTHKRGVAVDAFVAGHPLGEVVGPDELHKLGITVGGPNGDPSHVELAGIPVKRPPQAVQSGGDSGVPPQEGSPPDMGSPGGLPLSAPQ